MFDEVSNIFESGMAEPQASSATSWAPAKTVELVAEAQLPTASGDFRLIGYRSLTSDEEFVVIARGRFEPETPALVRVHSQCLTGDVFGSTKCDCGQQIQSAIKMIAREGRGAIVYQQQEGRGIGIINKIRAYALQDAGADTIDANEKLGLDVDLRRYDQCSEILLDLGIRRINLLSNNPEKIRALEKSGLEIVERVSPNIKLHPQLLRYLQTKREEMGHLLDLPEEFHERTKICGSQAV